MKYLIKSIKIIKKTKFFFQVTRDRVGLYPGNTYLFIVNGLIERKFISNFDNSILKFDINLPKIL